MPDEITSVAIDKCINYDINSIYPCLKNICEKAGMPDVSGRKVLLKPNILSDTKPENCITTHPEIIRALIRLLKNHGVSEIYVGDSPGLHTQTFNAKICGIAEVCEQEGALWSNFLDEPVTKRIDGTFAKLPMARILDEVDLVFSVCKFKTHTLMYATGATKNLFGIVPNVNKAVCHAKYPSRGSFAKLIVGIHETIKPAFCIMDAILAMEGAGPANGTPRALNLLIASKSCYAADAAQATIMGYDPNDIPILNEAKRRRLLPGEITYPILDAKDLAVPDYERIPIKKKKNLIKALFIPSLTAGIQRYRQKKEPAPLFNDKKCIRCLRCVKICPPKALSLKIEQDGNKHVVCDYNKCIRCYCCHEVCPVNAIHVENKKK
ncbi:MAG: DUF362 domain-containing protein [Sphaerochaeta sp.]